MNKLDAINCEPVSDKPDRLSPGAMPGLVASCLTMWEHQKAHGSTPKDMVSNREPSCASYVDLNDDDTFFPVRIRQVAGRGRGFFAARDIAANETVLAAAPLAWTVSSEWVKQVCMWCFAFDDRRVHPVKAVADHSPSLSAISTDANACKRGRKDRAKSSQPVHYKGTFCSQDCKQSAIAAFGGQSAWERFMLLLGNIEKETRNTNQQCLKPSNVYSNTADDCTDAAISVDGQQDNSGGISVPDLCIPEDADFDPEDATDEQLERWIDSVWDKMTETHIPMKNSLDDSHHDLIRLIASELCIHNAALMLAPTEYIDPDCVVTRDASNRDVAPAEFLELVKNNETDIFRAWLFQVQTELIQTKVSASPPATIAPIRLPQNPTISQIIHSPWAEVFRVPIAMFRLLNRAWVSTEQAYGPSTRLTHRRFRGVYYREKANSFGIWDPSSHYSASVYTNDPYEHQEMEWLGFAIYPTAVYFNHSCDPSIRKIRSGRTIRFVSNRDIKCGEELFIAYGSIAEPAPERRARLLEHFMFLCSCERCLAETSSH